MKLICNILAVVCFVFACVLSFDGKYEHAAFIMGMACFNRLNGLETA